MYPAIPLARDIELSADDFHKITALIYEQCGINLQEGKRELIKARLGKRIREGQFNSFREYYQFVVGDSSGQELVHLLDSISTNFTSFFREPQHFEFLRTKFLPELIERKRKGERKLSFWSAGCSSGEEVYSLVITLLENLEMSQSWKIKVLGTDISTKVLKTAESGVYSGERVQTIPQPFLHKYFLRGDNRWEGFVKVKDAVKKYTSFARLNFMETFSFPAPFDCV
ncbi:MAG: protein-glutamate O-methyltransferase CheR, partial [Deltaproteobacteria bacterium]|nr:protein-glutamate O-methyltransferase CheR [Deltaproteobacteria bacterium]